MQNLAVGDFTSDEIKAALHSARRELAFRYELLDNDNARRLWLDGVESASISHNSLASIKREAQFRIRDWPEVDWLNDRIRPWFRLRMPDTLQMVETEVQPPTYEELILSHNPVGYWRLGEGQPVSDLNLVPPFTEWTLNGGVINSDGTLTLTTGGQYAQSPLIRVDEADNWRVFLEALSDMDGPATRHDPGFSGIYYRVAYFAEDGVTPVENSSGWLANGHAPANSIVTGQWTRVDWSGVAGPGVVYIRWEVTSHVSYTSNSTHYRLPFVGSPNPGAVAYEPHYVPVETAIDSSGNGHHGTYQGAPLLGVDGAVIGDTAMFSQIAGDYFRSPYDQWVPGIGYSVEIWIKPTEFPPSAYSDFLQIDTDGHTETVIIRLMDDAQWMFYSRNAADTSWNYIPQPPGEATLDWTHLVVTWDGITFRGYVNGVEVGSHANPVLTESLGRIVTHSTGGTQPNGAIDELASYARALTADEVKAHYEAGKAIYRPTELRPKLTERWAEWPQGIYLLSTPTRQITAREHETRAIQAYDQAVILKDDKVEDRYTVTEATNVIDAVRTLLEGSGITLHSLVATDEVLPADRDWKPGTEKLEIINDLLSSINYRTLHFNSAGAAVAEPYQSPDSRPIGYTYAADSKSLLVPDATHELDLFAIANKWVLVVSEPEREPLIATYTNENPDSPTSTVNRGRTIVDFREEQEATSQEALDAQVQRLAFEASQIYEAVDFATALMPHHEDAELIQLDYAKIGEKARYVEHTWSMELKAGTTMKHRIRRVVDV